MTVENAEKTIATEGGHWYKRDGSPCYELPNASKPGEMRAVTIKDARKLDLVPSVTTVMNIMAKPGLDIWKRNQVLMSALTLPTFDGETLDSYSARVLIDAAEQGKAAADRGTRIHGSIERAIQGLSFPDEDSLFVKAALQEIAQFGDNYHVEKSFACNHFGGKVDLHYDGIVIDFKTKEFGPDAKTSQLTWPEQVYQLAAYRHGLGMPEARCFNIFVSVNNPGLAITVEWPEAKILQGHDVFMAALNLWQRVKGL